MYTNLKIWCKPKQKQKLKLQWKHGRPCRRRPCVAVITSFVLFQITWRRNDEELRSVSAVSSSVEEKLRIEGSGKFGNYSCSASNSISTSSSRLEFSGINESNRINSEEALKKTMRQFSINSQNLSIGGKDKQKFTRNLRKRNALLIQFLSEFS